MNEESLQVIRTQLTSAISDLQAVYLFGSALKEGRRLGSDVDLVDLRQATTVMRKEIIATGQRRFPERFITLS